MLDDPLPVFEKTHEVRGVQVAASGQHRDTDRLLLVHPSQHLMHGSKLHPGPDVFSSDSVGSVRIVSLDTMALSVPTMMQSEAHSYRSCSIYLGNVV